MGWNEGTYEPDRTWRNSAQKHYDNPHRELKRKGSQAFRRYRPWYAEGIKLDVQQPPEGWSPQQAPTSSLPCQTMACLMAWKASRKEV